MTFEFHPTALAEFKEAALWYEEQRHLLGLQFTAAHVRVLAVYNEKRRPGLWHGRT